MNTSSRNKYRERREAGLRQVKRNMKEQGINPRSVEGRRLLKQIERLGTR